MTTPMRQLPAPRPRRMLLRCARRPGPGRSRALRARRRPRRGSSPQPAALPLKPSARFVRRSWLRRSPAGGTSVPMADPQSKALFERARALIPGGVNSPVRAFRAVGGEPVFIARAKGARLFGADGGEYIDYVGSWGPAILGHAHPGRRPRRAGGGRARPLLRRADGGEVDFAEAVRAPLPEHRDDALRLQRHRSDDERHPRRARLHQARLHRQVRGLLPRPRRSPPREGRERARHLRRPRLGRRPRGHGAHHADAPLQRHRRARGALRGARRGDRRGDRGAGGRQHGLCPAGSRASSRRSSTSARSTARVSHLRRGDDRLSPRPRRRAGALSGSCPT